MNDSEKQTEPVAEEPKLTPEEEAEVAKAKAEVEALMVKAKAINIDYHCVSLMQSEPFFCRISRNIRKFATLAVPTAGVTWINEEFTMMWSPLFFAQLSDPEIAGVLKHEIYHIVLKHITSRKRENHNIWNIATDLAINSLLTKGGTTLPTFCLFPGKRPGKPLDGHVPEESKTANDKLCDLIASFPEEMSSEWYYDSIMKFCKDNNIPTEAQGCSCGGEGEEEGESSGGEQPGQDGDQKSGGKCPKCGKKHGKGGGIHGVNPMDDHGKWDDVPADAKQYVEEKINKIVSEAIHQADQSNGWGSIPASMQARLREMYSNQVDWRSLLRNFVGRSRGTTRVNSIKRINRKYPYIHPGVKRGYTANIAIFIDQSGSVGDEAISLLFGELNNLARTMDFDLYYFDTSVDEQNMVKWRRGGKVQARRTRCGGTDFDAVVEYANTKKAGCYDGIMILTDGECSQPRPCKTKLAWIVIPDRKLGFDHRHEEVLVQMKKAAKTEGW